jgi:PBSX family phage terminase large subunit
MQLSSKQKEFWNAPFHRWNVKSGATRSGKTYLDYYMIPRRIRERAGLPGLVVLMGNTKGTLQRNVIDPMIEMYGDSLVTSIRSDNTAMMFGERVYCLGADSKKHVDRLRGASIKYCYGDEVVTWEQEVFEMLKSRLDKEYSCFDGTCNPKDPEHWFKQFIDSGADIFSQSYSLDDNPFLPPSVRDALKSEHKGVFYDRHILGLWTVAEGLIFPHFAEDANAWDFSGDLPMFTKLTIGIDFGGNGSATRMTACGYVGGYKRLIVLDEAGLPANTTVDANAICRLYVDFYKRVTERFGRVDFVFGDSASPTMINTLVSAAKSAGLPSRHITGCRKNSVEDRPVTVSALLGSRRLAFLPGCSAIKKALASLRWDEKEPNRPEDKNIGNINDIYDSFCYCWLDFVEYIDRERVIY